MGEYTFNWRLKNISSYFQVRGESISSPIFSTESLFGSQWSLLFYPSGKTGKGNENFISWFLYCKKINANVEEIAIDFDFLLLDGNECVLNSEKYIRRPFKANGDWGQHNFFEIDKLIKEIENWNEDTLTLRCVIKSDDLSQQKCLKSESCTVFGIEQSFVIWDVTMPTLLKFSESKAFSILDLCKFEITLNSLNEAAGVNIHLLESKSGFPLRVTFKMIVLDSIGYELIFRRAVHSFKSAETWKFPDFITKEVLKATEIDLEHFKFKLICEAYITNKRMSSSSIETFEFASCCSADSILKRNPVSAMQSDFQGMFLSKKFSDVVVRAENLEFPAHKFMLGARSPVFEAMFEQDMRENQTGVVDVADMDGQTLKAFLEFLYKNSVQNLDYECAKNLLIAADKYQVPSLVDECIYFLKSVLSLQNVCETIAIADLVNSETLKSHALRFIKLNASKVLLTSNWEKYVEGNIKLSAYILAKLSEDASTKSKLNTNY